MKRGIFFFSYSLFPGRLVHALTRGQPSYLIVGEGFLLSMTLITSTNRRSPTVFFSIKVLLRLFASYFVKPLPTTKSQSDSTPVPASCLVTLLTLLSPFALKGSLASVLSSIPLCLPPAFSFGSSSATDRLSPPQCSCDSLS